MGQIFTGLRPGSDEPQPPRSTYVVIDEQANVLANVILELEVSGVVDSLEIRLYNDEAGEIGRARRRFERSRTATMNAVGHVSVREDEHGVHVEDIPPAVTPAPTEPGWYAYSGGRQTMIFHLRESGQWSAHFNDGSAADCDWGYIEQALGVFQILPLDTTPLDKIT